VRPCKKCGQYRDTIGGICGECMGRKTVKTRRKRTTGIIVVVIIASIGMIYGYQNFLESELASQVKEEAAEKLNQAKDFVEENYVKIPQ